MRLRVLAILVALLTVMGGVLAGTGQAAPRAEVPVSITEFMFAPSRIQVHVGDTVTWTNNGALSHTTTAKGRVWDSGVLSPGQMFSFTFNSQGVFKYRCQIHHQMTGAIRVIP